MAWPRLVALADSGDKLQSCRAARRRATPCGAFDAARSARSDILPEAAPVMGGSPALDRGNPDDAIVFGAGCRGTQRVRASRRRPASRRHSRTQRRRRPSPVAVTVVRLFPCLPPTLTRSTRIFREASRRRCISASASSLCGKPGRPTSRCNQTPVREKKEEGMKAERRKCNWKHPRGRFASSVSILPLRMHAAAFSRVHPQTFASRARRVRQRDHSVR
ncbi:uncharacterized protein LOC114933161 [Nylanderia fulva]|uniref:uncharacterized protein LOC114933161 n=1 Tax=Nylanderia fulva TaxID=613905 RepID=UPI0010FB5134|nr:uncharacterized protein LOC114933161 [Nylanderia fulva]